MSRKTPKNKDADIQKATVRTPVEKLRGKETIEHYNAVLLEDIKSKMEQVIEGMETTKVELRRGICDFRAEVNERFTVVEAVIGKNSEEIHNDTRPSPLLSKEGIFYKGVYNIFYLSYPTHA